MAAPGRMVVGKQPASAYAEHGNKGVPQSANQAGSRTNVDGVAGQKATTHGENAGITGLREKRIA